tara:strand:+ start:3045 stop:3536 length:492 start_codon:yes stop_codon:yes gene_type:complete
MKRIWIAIVFCFLTSNVFAAELKIGVVNLEQVIQKSPLAVSINQKLSTDFKPRQDAVNAASKKLQESSDKLTYGAFKLTPEQRLKLQEEVIANRRSVEQLMTSLQADIASAQAKANQTLMTKLNTVIASIAKSGSYDIIQTNANMIYLNGNIDITQQVIDKLK